MIKTNVDKPAKPDVMMIARGILKGYLKHPDLFMIRLVPRLMRMRRKVNANIPGDIAGLLAMIAAMYSLFREGMDQPRALCLLKAVIIPIGLVKQMALFRFVEDAKHDFANLVKYSKAFKK